jgi:hypothetical protein
MRCQIEEDFAMRTQRLSIAIAATAIVAAASASSALAGTAVTQTASWTIGGSVGTGTIPVNTQQPISCSKTAATPVYVLKGTVAGAALEVTAGGVECSEAKITNLTVGTHMAQLTTKLTLTTVAIKKPAGCTTPKMLQTSEVTADLKMDQTVNTKSYLDFASEGPSVGSLTIEGCAVEGKYPIKGAFLCEMTDATEVQTVVQECAYTATTNAMSGLTIGGNAATLEGEVAFELTGANAGKAWGAEPH